MADMLRRPGPSRGQKKRSNPMAFWAWVIIPALIVVAWKVAILVVLGMLPTLVALIIDRRPEKYAAYCVGGFNLCGLVPWVVKLFVDGQSSVALQHIMTNPFSWLVIYGAAAIGWLVFSWTPELVLRMTAFRDRQEIASLQKRQETLVEEWGPDIIPPRAEEF